jgi:epoxyqueuosine reductase
MLNCGDLSSRIRQEALRLGFEAVGITTADPPEGRDAYARWLDKGYAAEMGYLHRHRALKRDLNTVLDGVRSVVVTAKNYFQPEPPTDRSVPGGARVSRYAAGQDYHDYVRADLRELLAFVQEWAPGCRGRIAVDSAPVLERDLAQRAGVGWIGKNAMLVRRGLGSFFFLGELLLDVDLAPDAPAKSSCGACRQCMDACPTGAIVEPGVVDARLCISYQTVEHRGELPADAEGRLDGWVFGCDVCQQVCPWNHKASVSADPRCQALAALDPLDVRRLAELDEAGFQRAFAGSPIRRAGREGLARNVAAVSRAAGRG